MYKALLLLVALTAEQGTGGGAQSDRDGSYQLVFMGAQVAYESREFVGHAFACLQIRVGIGMKEECFGFYPRADSALAFIGSAGMTDEETRRNPTRFSRIGKSLTVGISAAEMRSVRSAVKNWNGRRYSLTHQNCIDFIGSMAQAVGLRVPPRVRTEFPVHFVTALADANRDRDVNR